MVEEEGEGEEGGEEGEGGREGATTQTETIGAASVTSSLAKKGLVPRGAGRGRGRGKKTM